MFIRDTGSEFFHPGSRIQGQKDSGSPPQDAGAQCGAQARPGIIM
jgi:hypothetical protein